MVCICKLKTVCKIPDDKNFSIKTRYIQRNDISCHKFVISVGMELSKLCPVVANVSILSFRARAS